MLAKLCVVFLVIVVMIYAKRPLYQALLAALAATVLLYQIPLRTAGSVLATGAVSFTTVTTVLSLYVVTVLQKMLERRQQLKIAQQKMTVLLRSRRINACIAPALMGLVPSASVMYICGSIVEDTCGEDLSREEKAFVTSWFRHTAESFLPTYTSVLLAIALSGINTGAFVLGMLPMVAMMFALGYLFYLRRIPKYYPNQKLEYSREEKLQAACQLLRSIWSLVAVVLLILVFDLAVYVATPLVIVVNLFVDRFSLAEFFKALREGVEPVLLMNTFIIMLFKDILTHTGVIYELPEFFGQLPIPTLLSFALILFFGTIVSGSQAIVPICIPMACAAMPEGGTAMIVLLMSFAYAAMQLSPTHVCLYVASDCYKVSLGDIIKKTIPVALCFCVVAYGYGCLLMLL